MRMNIFYLLGFALHSITADLKHDVVEEKKQITLHCPHNVTSNVTWSREINGNKVDILTTFGDKTTKHIKEPPKRYDTLADKSLFILRLSVSHSGSYSCNYQPAVELTVIPSGIKIQDVTERSDISLKCPHDDKGSHSPTWSREIAGKPQQIKGKVSAVDKTWTIKNVEKDDFGLYFCDGKPAFYLNVTKKQKSHEGKKGTTTPTTQTTTRMTTLTVAGATTGTTAKSSFNPAAATPPVTSPVPHSITVINPPILLVGIGCLVILIIIIVIICYTWRHRFKSQGLTVRRSDSSNMKNLVYENCNPPANENQTYQSLNPATQDHNQIYSTLTEQT